MCTAVTLSTDAHAATDVLYIVKVATLCALNQLSGGIQFNHLCCTVATQQAIRTALPMMDILMAGHGVLVPL